MSTTIIHIPVEQVLDRLGHGNLWVRNWGTPDDSTQPTCLHGAIRFCAPVPGDAQLIEQVGARFGFGTFANDQAADFAALTRRYGVEVIAEKVENERQVVDILELDVGMGQGHLFGEPRAIKEQVLAETDPPAEFLRSTLRSAEQRRRF